MNSSKLILPSPSVSASAIMAFSSASVRGSPRLFIVSLKILQSNVHHLIFLSSPMLTLHHRNIVKYSILKIQTNSPVKRHAFLDCVNFESVITQSLSFQTWDPLRKLFRWDCDQWRLYSISAADTFRICHPSHLLSTVLSWFYPRYCVDIITRYIDRYFSKCWQGMPRSRSAPECWPELLGRDETVSVPVKHLESVGSILVSIHSWHNNIIFVRVLD